MKLLLLSKNSRARVYQLNFYIQVITYYIIFYNIESKSYPLLFLMISKFDQHE